MGEYWKIKRHFFADWVDYPLYLRPMTLDKYASDLDTVVREIMYKYAELLEIKRVSRHTPWNRIREIMYKYSELLEIKPL